MASKIERVSRKMTPEEKAQMLKATKEIAEEREDIIAKVNATESGRTIRTRVTDEIYTALKTHCELTGSDLSEIIRESVLRHIGRRDLLGTMPGPGRPKGN